MPLPERGNSNKLTPGRLIPESEARGRPTTRSFNYGDEKESSWPPQFGSNEKKGGVFHIDKATGKLVEGHAPSKVVKFGEAPYVIGDTTEGYYHPGAQEWTDSKSKLKALDKATGCITTDKMQKADGFTFRERQRAMIKDSEEALHKAVSHIDQGLAPISEETQAMCDTKNETVSRALGIDAFNMVGRKKNAKGKRFRRPGVHGKIRA